MNQFTVAKLIQAILGKLIFFVKIPLFKEYPVYTYLVRQSVGHGTKDIYFVIFCKGFVIFDGFFLFQSLEHDGEVKEEKISSLQSQLTDLQMDSTTEVIFHCIWGMSWPNKSRNLKG